MRLHTLILLILLSTCLLEASQQKALIIASDYGVPGSLYNAAKLMELGDLLKENHKYSVTILENKDPQTLSAKANEFVRSIDSGDIVFVYLLGHGITDTGEKRIYLTSGSGKWDIQANLIDPLAAKSKTGNLADIEPVIVFDLLYDHGSMINTRPLDKLQMDHNVFLAMYSNTPGENPSRSNTPILLELCKQLSNRDTRLDYRRILDAVASSVSGLEPLVVGNTQGGASINPKGKETGSIYVGGDDDWKARLKRLSKQPETYVVGTGVIGGLIFMATKIFISKPDELPDPPGPPGR